MRKILLGLVLGCVFIGGNLFALDGDLIVLNGRVGIGTEYPGYKLHVNGIITAGNPTTATWAYINAPYMAVDTSVYSYGRICAGNNSGTCDSANGVVIAGSGTAAYGNVYFTGLGNNYINSGNVGIGTTTPAKKLHVIDPTGTWALRATRQGTGTTGFGGAAELVLHTSDDMQDGFGPGLMLSIQDNGAGPNYIGGVYATREGSDTSGKLHFLTRNGADWNSRMAIDKRGYVGVGTNNPSFLLTMEASGGGYYNQSTHAWVGGSSGRKSGIKPIAGALDTVLKLNGVSFKWKKRTDTFEDSIDGTKLYVSSSWADDPNGRDDIGLIAEDVMKVLPELVDVDQKDPNFATGVPYSKMVALLIEAIKEQQREIVKLKEDLEALKK